MRPGLQLQPFALEFSGAKMITRSTHCPCPGRGCPIVDSPRRVPSCPCTNYTHYYSYDNYTIIKLNLHTPKPPLVVVIRGPRRRAGARGIFATAASLTPAAVAAFPFCFFFVGGGSQSDPTSLPESSLLDSSTLAARLRLRLSSVFLAIRCDLHVRRRLVRL